MIFQEPMTSLNPFHKVGKQIQESIRLHQKLTKEESKNEAINLMKLLRFQIRRIDIIHIHMNYPEVKGKGL